MEKSISVVPCRVAILLALALLGSLIVGLLVGCDGQGDAGGGAIGAQEPESVVVLVGNHANAPQAQVYPQVRELLQAATQTRGYVAFVSVEGTPRLVDGAIVGSDAPTQRVRADENEGWIEGLSTILSSNIAAKTPESDPLEALRLANRTLASAPAGLHHIVVIDSGLATVGPISFTQEDMIYAWPKDVASYLDSIDALIAFDEGVTVDWYGLGDVASPQAALTSHQRNSLRDIWTEIIERSGATVIFHDDPPTAQTLDGLPAVSSIDLEGDPLPEIVDMQEPIIFDESVLHFWPDTADFIDQQDAEALLGPYAELLAAHPEIHVHLIGTTATFGSPNADEDSYELSRQRAQKVYDVLVSLGAPPEQMETEGQGSFDRWHLDEYDEQGNYLPQVAAQNRKVVMVEKSTPHDCVLDPASRNQAPGSD
ncbi:MAG: OmpA family protein [Coriobacteriales bacterium]|jgi:outer membrane protein OmpA-like peptidoglycan-associated protein|nr:OmpA family protein [Coriobacteriales bacterium]